MCEISSFNVFNHTQTFGLHSPPSHTPSSHISSDIAHFSSYHNFFICIQYCRKEEEGEENPLKINTRSLKCWKFVEIQWQDHDNVSQMVSSLSSRFFYRLSRLFWFSFSQCFDITKSVKLTTFSFFSLQQNFFLFFFFRDSCKQQLLGREGRQCQKIRKKIDATMRLGKFSYEKRRRTSDEDWKSWIRALIMKIWAADVAEEQRTRARLNSESVKVNRKIYDKNTRSKKISNSSQIATRPPSHLKQTSKSERKNVMEILEGFRNFFVNFEFWRFLLYMRWDGKPTEWKSFFKFGYEKKKSCDEHNWK